MSAVPVLMSFRAPTDAHEAAVMIRVEPAVSGHGSCGSPVPPVELLHGGLKRPGEAGTGTRIATGDACGMRMVG